MKKFYSSFLSVAVAFTAVAGSPFQLRQAVTPSRVANSDDGVVAVADDFGDKLSHDVMAKASRASESDVISGEYTVVIGDYYFPESTGEQISYDCTLKVDGDVATLTSPIFPIEVVGKFDPGYNSITFELQKFGQLNFDGGEKYYVNFEPFKYTFDEATKKGSIAIRSFSISYADGVFSCPVDYGFRWGVYADAEFTESMGVLQMYDLISLTKKDSGDDVDPDKGWTTLDGKAVLADPWMLPRYSLNPVEHEIYRYEVTVQQNDDNPNIYRLVDPYKGNSPIASQNKSTKTGYIQFDVTDPDHVSFAAVDAGFVNNTPLGDAYPNGIEKLYCLNYLSYTAGRYGWTPQQVIQMLGTSCPYTTYKDGVITLGGNDTADDAIVGINDRPFGGFRWTVSGVKVSMRGFIKMPDSALGGISDIDADDDAPVRYFNLQGVEVSDPQPGEMVIRLSGSKATKIVIK